MSDNGNNMKKFLFLWIITIAISACNDRCVTITGTLKGLTCGDTLSFTISRPPFFEDEYTDTIVVTGEQFLFEIPATHTISGYIRHHKEGYNLGIYDIVARPGEHLHISGEIEAIGGAHIEGGLYNLPDIKRLHTLSAPIESLKSVYSKKLSQFNGNEVDSMTKYSDLYKKLDYPDEYKSLWQSIRDSANNEYAAYMCMKRIYKYAAHELKERIDRFTGTTQSCDIVNELRELVPIINNIAEGNFLPNYTFIDNTDKNLSLHQYRGKFLLLYYYGLCPGVIYYSEEKIDKLYNKYRDKGLEIIGICRDGDISKNYERIDSADKNIKSMLTHSYPTVYATDNRNKYLQHELLLISTPCMILIAPDGKTLVKGGNETHKRINKILQEALIEKEEKL